MFIIKIKATATKTNTNFKNEVHNWIIGKDGYVHERINEYHLIPWKRKFYAEKWIKEDREWQERYDAEHNQHFWDYEYEIVEI